VNEAETRAEHIDPAWKAAGWGVVGGSRIRGEYLVAPGRIEGLGRRGNPEDIGKVFTGFQRYLYQAVA
jgi:type I restriction enzyme, R subunit